MTRLEREEPYQPLLSGEERYQQLLTRPGASISEACQELFGQSPEELATRIKQKPPRQRKPWEKEVLAYGWPLLEKDRQFIAEIIAPWQKATGLQLKEKGNSLEVLDCENFPIVSFNQYRVFDEETINKTYFRPWQDGDVRKLMYLQRTLVDPIFSSKKEERKSFHQAIAARIFERYCQRFFNQPLVESEEKVEKIFKEISDPFAGFYLTYYFVTNVIKRLQEQRTQYSTHFDNQILQEWLRREEFLYERFIAHYAGSFFTRVVGSWHKAAQEEDFPDWFSPRFGQNRYSVLPTQFGGKNLRQKFSNQSLREVIQQYESETKEKIKKGGLPLMPKDLDYISSVIQSNIDLAHLPLQIQQNNRQVKICCSQSGEPLLVFDRYRNGSFFDGRVLMAGDVLPYFDKSEAIAKQQITEKILQDFWRGFLKNSHPDLDQLQSLISNLKKPAAFTALLEEFSRLDDSRVHPAVLENIASRAIVFKISSPFEQQIVFRYAQKNSPEKWLFLSPTDKKNFAFFKETFEENLYYLGRIDYVTQFSFGIEPEELFEKLKNCPNKLSPQQKAFLEKGLPLGIEDTLTAIQVVAEVLETSQLSVQYNENGKITIYCLGQPVVVLGYYNNERLNNGEEVCFYRKFTNYKKQRQVDKQLTDLIKGKLRRN